MTMSRGTKVAARGLFALVACAFIYVPLLRHPHQLVQRQP